MNLFTKTLVFSLLFIAGCTKDKECKETFNIPDCITESFPDSEFSLRMKNSEDNSMLVFESSTTDLIESIVIDDFTDECYEHKQLIVSAQNDLENFSISFSYLTISIGGGFLVSLVDDVKNTTSRFNLFISENCTVREYTNSYGIEKSLLLPSIELNDVTYTNVHRILNNAYDDGMEEPSDSLEYVYLYFSNDFGILKIESFEDSWEVTN